MGVERLPINKDFFALVQKGIIEENLKFRREERRMKLHALIIPALAAAEMHSWERSNSVLR